jgi:DNA-binding response OmpR family regulator
MQVAQEQTTGTALLGGRRVLVVDDNAGTATLVAGALLDAGAAVDVVRSADAAVAQAARRNPGAIVIHLPVPKDAAAALGQRLRGHPVLAGTRLVILSGEDRVDDASAELADAVQARPISMPRLVADVARLMHDATAE